MRAWSRTFTIAAVTGLLMVTAAPASSPAMQAGVSVYAVISFVQPSIASKVSDLSLGSLGRREGFEQVSLSPDGTLHASGKGRDIRSRGQPSVITLSNTRDSIVNFVPANYHLAGGVGSIQASCATEAGGPSCTGAPYAGGLRTLYIGMDMTLADSIELQGDKGSKQSSFDMSIVYQ